MILKYLGAKTSKNQNMTAKGRQCQKEKKILHHLRILIFSILHAFNVMTNRIYCP